MRGADASNDRDVCLRIGSDGQSQGRRVKGIIDGR